MPIWASTRSSRRQSSPARIDPSQDFRPPRASIAARTRSGVNGISLSRTPIASSMALAIGAAMFDDKRFVPLREVGGERHAISERRRIDRLGSGIAKFLEEALAQSL